MKTRAVTLLMVVLVIQQCGAPAGKDVGGDSNPSTGACTIAFEETTSDGVHHRYPEFVNPELRLIAGKVIFFCGHPPTLHHATAALEKRRLGAGAQWTSADKQESSRIPRPKDSLFLRGTCEFGLVEMWRVHVWVKGAGTGPDGKRVTFDVEDFSQDTRTTCRERR